MNLADFLAFGGPLHTFAVAFHHLFIDSPIEINKEMAATVTSRICMPENSSIFNYQLRSG